MATIAKLMVELGMDDNSFARGISNAQDRLESLGSSARKWGGLLTAGVTTPILATGVALVKWVSDLEQTLGATEQLWGDNAASIIAWSESADTSLGLTQDQALTSMNRFNAMFKQMSSDSGVIRTMSEDFTTLSADLSAMWGGSTIEAADALTSALRGNYEGLDRYNINLTEAMVNQEAMNIAVAAGRDEITEADKVQARYNLVMEQSADAQGQFARETDTTAGRLAIATARAKNLATGFGRLLLPATNSLLGAFAKVLDFLESLSPGMQKWVVGIAAAAAALGPLLLIIGMLLPGLSALLGVLGFLLSPIGLIIAAVALLAYIFRDELRAALDWAIEKFGELSAAFKVFNQMTDPVTAALKALALVFPGLRNVIEPLIEMVGNLKTAFQQIKDGDFGGAFASIAAAARNLWESVKAAWSNIDWAGMLSALGSLTIALAGWLYDQATAVDWGGVLSTAAATAGDITKSIVSKLGDLGAALFVWLWDAASSIPWGDVLAAAVTVGDIVSTIVGKLGDLGAGLKTWYDNAIESVNWGGLGETVGAKVGDLSRTLAPKAGELIQGFLTAVVNPGLWAGVGTALLTLILALPTAIGYVGLTMAPKALEFLQGFVTGLDINWYTVAIWLALLPMKLLSAVGSLATTLLAKGMELITGFYNGMVAAWPMAGLYLITLGIKALAAVPALTRTLWQKGMDIIDGFRTGMIDSWMKVITYLGQRGTQAIAHIGSLSTTLTAKGRDLITGFLVGVTAKWLDVSSFLSSIGGKAVSAVGSLGGLLYSAGASLIQGLIDGVGDKIGELQSLLGSVTGMIPDWKGPPERDAKLLVPNGRLIMGGLSRGLDDGWQDVTRQLSSYVPEINGMSDGSLAGGNRGQVVQIITLEPGKWKEFLDNAMAGGEFAANFGPEMAMYGGKP